MIREARHTLLLHNHLRRLSMYSIQPNSSLPDRNLLLPVEVIDLDTTSATQIAGAMRRTLVKRPQLLVDCNRLKCMRTLGISHVISELLVLHRAGAHVWLRNASPVLRHCLALLKLTHVFPTFPGA